MIGDVFRIRNWRHHDLPDPDAKASRIWVDLSHPDKNMVGVFVLLGFERKDGTGPRVDANEALQSIGWTPTLAREKNDGQ